MDWQDFAALGIVAATAVWLAVRSFRRRRHAHSCGGCPGTLDASARQSSIVFHARKGERPVITVKMK